MNCKLIRAPEVRELLGNMSRASFWRLQTSGEFIQPVRCEGRILGYLEDDLHQWLESRKG